MKQNLVAYRAGNVVVPQFVLIRMYREGIDLRLLDTIVDSRRREFIERGMAEARKIECK